MMELSEPVMRPVTEEERKRFESGDWEKAQRLEDWEPVGD
jgi:isocitrate dehydrogenase kinase/phosphatase